MRRPNTILKYSNYAYCSELSYILLRLAERSGIPARHVGLVGHVVMEAWYNGDWHMYDPSTETEPRGMVGSVLSVKEVRRTPAALALYDQWPALKATFRHPQLYNYISYPNGSEFVWQAQLLYFAEGITEWLKYAIPILLILLGCIEVLRKRLRNTATGISRNGRRS